MSPDGSSIRFERCPKSLDRRWIRAFHKRLLGEVTFPIDFICLITGDRQLQALNSLYLKRDYPADVLSFPETEESPGQVAISVDRARAQAEERGHSVEHEIGILMLHGALHLLGMDHERDRGRMARAEKNWRSKLGLPEGLIERAARKR